MASVPQNTLPPELLEIWREAKDFGPGPHILTGPIFVNGAAEMAVRETILFLAEEKGLNREDAYMLTSVGIDLEITQLVDGGKGVHAMILKTLFTRP